MRKFWAAAVLVLFLAPAVFAGQPFNEDSPEQRTMPPVIVNIDTPPVPPSDNTGAYIAAAGVVLAAGIGYLGVRKSRKG